MPAGKISALKPPAVLHSEFGKLLSSPIPFKMKSYTKLINNVFKYSNPKEHVLLWYEIYHQSKVSDLHSLPHTSADLYLHFLRCVYTIYIQTQWLQNVTVDPTNYGYEDKNFCFLFYLIL